MPCSKSALPFPPTDAKWPFTFILSGAVSDLLTVPRRPGNAVDECEDTGERAVGEAILEANCEHPVTLRTRANGREGCPVDNEITVLCSVTGVGPRCWGFVDLAGF